MARFKNLSATSASAIRRAASFRRTSVSLVSARSGARASETLALRAVAAILHKCGSCACGHRPWFVFAAVLVIAALTAGDAMACPMCKAALGSHDSGHGDLVGGFFWSILFMLSMPFLIFGSLSTYLYLLVRRARREQAERGSAPAAAEMFTDASVDERVREPVGAERR